MNPLSLAVNDEPGAPGIAIQARDPALEHQLTAYLDAGSSMHSILWVEVVQPGASSGNAFPKMLGRYDRIETAMRFTPHFPLDPGVLYRATYDPGPLQDPNGAGVSTLDFSPRLLDLAPTELTRIYPSSDGLPENLLRFYLCFSNAMQRGHVAKSVSIRDRDGRPVDDVLYRAPVELWDPSMRILTVLLDPGRLKRGVGPNRALGPPLAVGETYTLRIETGMIDRQGRRLREPVHKRFTVTAAVRERVPMRQWRLTAPVAGGFQPLVLDFTRALDWALLFHCLTISSSDGQSVRGRIEVDRSERRWRFVPQAAWTAGRHTVTIDATLEDPCGNDMLAPFDRPIRTRSDRPGEVSTFTMPFEVNIESEVTTTEGQGSMMRSAMTAAVGASASNDTGVSRTYGP